MRLKPLVLTGIFVICLALPTMAHHSHGNYTMGTWTELEGTVTELHLVNPHVWVYLEVEDEDGASAVWALEAASPGELTRSGIPRDSFSIGDTIRVQCNALRDGSNGCLLGFVYTSTGLVQDWDGGGATPPEATRLSAPE